MARFIARRLLLAIVTLFIVMQLTGRVRFRDQAPKGLEPRSVAAS